MKFAYFPGCAIQCSAQEYGTSCKAVSKILGLELLEIPDWNCCGAIDAVYSYDPLLSITLSARNLALAETMNMDMVTLCSACFFTMSRANKLLHEEAKLKWNVDAVLSGAGLKYAGEVKVRHYLEILVNEIGFDEISKHVKVPLKGLRVAPYYGCLLVRPPETGNFDDPEHPKSLDKLVEVLGARSVNYTERCCGASLVLTDESVMMEMTKRSLLNAKNAGADCVITTCPLCQFNLDVKQRDIESSFDLKIGLPILYFTQLIGVAFGLGPKELGLDRNYVSSIKLLRSFKFL